MSALETAVARAERARSVAQADAECARLTRELTAAEQEAQNAQKTLTDADNAREIAAQELAAAQELQKDAAVLRAELAAAEQRLPELVALDAAQRAETEAQRLLEPVSHRVAQLEQTVQQRSDALEQGRTELRRLEQLGTQRLPAAQALCDRYAQSGKLSLIHI